MKTLGWLTTNDLAAAEREQENFDRMMVPSRLLQKDRPDHLAWAKNLPEPPIVYHPAWHGSPDHVDSNFYAQMVEARYVAANMGWSDRIAWDGKTRKYWYNTPEKIDGSYAVMLANLLDPAREIGCDTVMLDYIDWKDPALREWQKRTASTLSVTWPVILNGRPSWGWEDYGKFVESMGKINNISLDQTLEELNHDVELFIFDTFRLTAADYHRLREAEDLARFTNGYVCPGRIRKEGLVTR